MTDTTSLTLNDDLLILKNEFVILNKLVPEIQFTRLYEFEPGKYSPETGKEASIHIEKLTAMYQEKTLPGQFKKGRNIYKSF